MIEELVYTSVPKGLKPDTSGFCVVAETEGLAPNLSNAMKQLSGYRHTFDGKQKALNPVSCLHIISRVGGIERHIVSRIADCGADYSGRTNLIAHHWAFSEHNDLIPCGPATILSQPNLFRTVWNEPPHKLQKRGLPPNLSVSPKKCTAWERQLGDAGWGGIVAERAEKGDPISLIFEPGTDVLPLLAEAFALLPQSIRWKITFSTFFMKPQEPPGANKVQIKCILAGSDEEAFARLTPNTLVIDLRQRRNDVPAGKYVGVARNGAMKPQSKPKEFETPSPIREPLSQPQSVAASVENDSREVYELEPIAPPTNVAARPQRQRPSISSKTKGKKKQTRSLTKTVALLILALTILGI
ncbi:MAG: hypothetical protein LBU65_05090, partial [Planctomycetaceae bacterium]|nr:hypothetical protein [Planctomycetaceae bacterium]